MSEKDVGSSSVASKNKLMKTIEIEREEDTRDRYRTEAMTDITTENIRTGTEDITTKTGEMKKGVAENIAT